ncbi:hypothetical protein AMTRI_Chr10g480 [Amborella trichopoda]
MDYSKWAETHQQQQQQPVSSQLHPTDSFSLHQPYHPYYPLYHNPSTHQPSEYGVPSSLKLPQNGPHYSAPPSMASQSHNALDISQSDTSLRPPGSESYAPMGPPTMSSYTPQSGFEGQGPYHTHIPGAMPPNLGYYQDPETQSWAAKEAIKQFGADPLVFGANGCSEYSRGRGARRIQKTKPKTEKRNEAREKEKKKWLREEKTYEEREQKRNIHEVGGLKRQLKPLRLLRLVPPSSISTLLHACAPSKLFARNHLQGK